MSSWKAIALQCQGNAEYYRGIVEEIGEMLGKDVYISDDGSVQQDILAERVPEVVRTRLSRSDTLRRTLEGILEGYHNTYTDKNHVTHTVCTLCGETDGRCTPWCVKTEVRRILGANDDSKSA